MRKGLLIAIVAIGSAITGSAQTSQSGLGGLSISAKQIRRIDNQQTFSGNVEIVIGGTRVRADTATFDMDTKTIDLSGHVQLTLPPETK